MRAYSAFEIIYTNTTLFEGFVYVPLTSYTTLSGNLGKVNGLIYPDTFAYVSHIPSL